jgi:hypothetical protein
MRNTSKSCFVINCFEFHKGAVAKFTAVEALDAVFLIYLSSERKIVFVIFSFCNLKVLKKIKQNKNQRDVSCTEEWTCVD